MDLWIFLLLAFAAIPVDSVRLHRIFQFIDGFKSDYYLQGWLHVGNNYAVLLRKPKPHDKYLTYELYEAKNLDDINDDAPRLLAISKVPTDYIKEQLQAYRIELHNAKYVDPNVVPGTQVRTLREWQISKSLNQLNGNNIFLDKPNVLRARME